MSPADFPAGKAFLNLTDPLQSIRVGQRVLTSATSALDSMLESLNIVGGYKAGLLQNDPQDTDTLHHMATPEGERTVVG